MMSRITILLLLSVLSACASYNGRPQAPVSTSVPAVVTESSSPAATPSPVQTLPAPVRTAPDLRPETPPPQPAPQRPSEPATPASTLQASVDQAIAEGDLERAAALSERALRINPRDGYLWYSRADISFQQRRYSEAEGFARRALSFAGSDRSLTQQINQLLSRIASASN